MTTFTDADRRKALVVRKQNRDMREAYAFERYKREEAITMTDAVNEAAVVKFLRENHIEYEPGEPNIEDGWVLEILASRIEGKQLEDLMKVIDTQQNVNLVVLKNIGLVIATEGAV